MVMWMLASFVFMALVASTIHLAMQGENPQFATSRARRAVRTNGRRRR